MQRMRIDAELTQRLQLWDSHSWACVGIADLTLKRSLKRSSEPFRYLLARIGSQKRPFTVPQDAVGNGLQLVQH